PTNNNLRTSSNTSRANQDNSLRINRSTWYENQRIGNVTRARETVEQADWRDDTDEDELQDQELEAHYMYMKQLQEIKLYKTREDKELDKVIALENKVKEIWLRVQQMMKGSDIGIQEKKAKLFNEWE
nr:hypothetical protein [Tanacetum cinerariifolium]